MGIPIRWFVLRRLESWSISQNRTEATQVLKYSLKPKIKGAEFIFLVKIENPLS
jgi:hypothetical protein